VRPSRGSVAKTGPFTRDLFQFLRELKQNNNRDWFQRNKDRYETSVRDPVLRFVVDIGPRIKRLSPYFVADANPVGGSMTRIYRDLRFSKDKTPFKTAIGVHFWHERGKDGATPAFYLHLEPDNSSAGSGIWRPEPRALKSIRDAIAEDPRKWERAISSREFRSSFSMLGESLRRPPSGYNPDHPFIQDLKRRDFAVSSSLPSSQVWSPDFMEVLLEAFRASAPFARFLAQAVGLPF
jgi:uncharacterized protein (TIGR02453 family)